MKFRLTRDTGAYWLNTIIYLLPILALLFTSLKRTHRLHHMVGDHLQKPGVFLLEIIHHDSMIYAIIFCCYLLGSTSRWWINLIPRVGIVLIVTTYIVDWLVYTFTGVRLTIEDLIHYALEFDAFYNYIFSTPKKIAFFGTLIFSWPALGTLFICVSKPPGRRTLPGMMIAFGLSLSVLMLTPGLKSIHTNALGNIIVINLDVGYRTRYSLEFQEALLPQGTKSYQTSPPFSCPTQSNLPNIILVTVESLSPYHSKLMSGINDWVPNIDTMARSGTYYSNFYASGYHSAGGIQALLTGEVPFPTTFLTEHASHNYDAGSEPLPKSLNRCGYHSAMLTTGQLNFSNFGSWLEHIGFSYIEGSKGNFYEGWHRGVFNAAPDEALFKRVITYINERPSEEPQFLYLHTYGTHQPYYDPISKSSSEEDCFRTTDASLFEFYSNLNQIGYFKNGILIITSDHRAMTPPFEQETNVLGQAAASRIPLIILSGSDQSKVVSEPYSQADIPASIRSFISQYRNDKIETHNLQLAHGPFSGCSLHAQGNNRSIVDVFCADNYTGQIYLDGDRTSFISPSPPNGTVIIKKINQQRMVQRLAHEDHIEESTDQ